MRIKKHVHFLVECTVGELKEMGLWGTEEFQPLREGEPDAIVPDKPDDYPCNMNLEEANRFKILNDVIFQNFKEQSGLKIIFDSNSR